MSNTPTGTSDSAAVGVGRHLDLVEEVLVGRLAVLLEELHHDLAHVDLLLHQRKDGPVLFAWLHQDVISEC